MPNREAHKIFGTVTGAVTAVSYGYYKEQNFENAWQFALGGGLGGYLTSTLADKLEPATSPNHRCIFHGVALNGVLAIKAYEPTKNRLQSLVDKANEYDVRQEPFKAFLYRLAVGLVIGGVGGYASHLTADSRTTRSLPLIC